MHSTVYLGYFAFVLEAHLTLKSTHAVPCGVGLVFRSYLWCPDGRFQPWWTGVLSLRSPDSLITISINLWKLY